MINPISQFITYSGCIIQGVTEGNSEIMRIHCPRHRRIERVYSFKRDVDLNKPLSDGDKKLIKRLLSEFKEKPDIYRGMEEKANV